MDLNGRRVLVTGASRGIGEAVAHKAAAAGADVALVARSAQPLEVLVAELGGTAYPADLLDRQATRGLIARIEADGPVDVLVNNAGVDPTAAYVDFDPDLIDDQLELNLHVPMQLSRQLLPGLLERGTGHIVNVSSMAGTFALPGMAAHAASKAGLSHFTAGLRAEVRGTKVGTTLVEIGPAQTGMMDTLRSHPPAERALGRFEGLKLSYDLSVDRVAEAIVDAVVHGRRHVRLPRWAAAFPILVELPRVIGEWIIGDAGRA